MKKFHSSFPVKRLHDGRALVNLGSSTRCAAGWNNVDFSWIVRLGRHRRLCAFLHKERWLSPQRYERILNLDPETVLWDLRNGVPFADASFDVVYHSHLLEHIDREEAPAFLRECLRVLKPGGILRVVVPDLEVLARNYLRCLERLPERGTMADHFWAVEEMIDQMVVRAPKSHREQKPVVRFLENLLIGDTSRNGALHRWMYDCFSLSEALRGAGFAEIKSCDERTSRIEGWTNFFLDTRPDGSTYKPGSIYLEGTRSQ